jgi:hypothetical protein
LAARRGLWQPGQSGNPNGRPSTKGPVEALARTYTEEAVETLAELMRNGFPDAVRGAAANALLNRGWGSPRRSDQVLAKPIEEMTLEEVEAEIERLTQEKLASSVNEDACRITASKQD